ncbi:hypothetical protein GCM10027019_23170 [Melaminivora jejuensis]
MEHAAPRPAHPAEAIPTSAMVIDYVDETGRQAIADAGLLPAFEAYWSAHVNRRWSDLFDMESATKLPSREFYTAYHSKAWPVLSLQVVDAQFEQDSAVLTLHIRVQDPARKGRQQSLYRKDHWQQVDGRQWQHTVTDPMLIGIRQ